MSDDAAVRPMRKSSRAYLVWFKDEKDAQQAVTLLGAVEGVVSVGIIDARVADQARNMQARAASAKPEQR
jgi:hypothetical protein